MEGDNIWTTVEGREVQGVSHTKHIHLKYLEEEEKEGKGKGGGVSEG